MYEIVEGSSPRKSVHFQVLTVCVVAWVLMLEAASWWSGSSVIFEQNAALVLGAVFFFSLDFATALIFRVGVRGEQSFSSAGMASGAKKLALWVVIGAGGTVWSNTFPNDPDTVRWTNPKWVGANVDLLGFLYMYAMDLLSSVENITGKTFGQTRIGRATTALFGFFLNAYLPEHMTPEEWSEESN